MNINIAAAIIQRLRLNGVRDFCLCAGARNSPFIALLEDNQNLLNKEGRLFHFFEERSASFFALGRSQQTQRPVVVITTSGTAATELISASVEAYYTQTPLIFITADRPSSYRHTGAPQSINQIGIFSHYAWPTIEIENSLEALEKLSDWNRKIPLHLNVCFDEPLLDEPLPQLKPLDPRESQEPLNTGSSAILGSPSSAMRDFQQKCKNPLVIIGGLSPAERQFVLPILSDYPGAFLIESLSGLRGHKSLEASRIQSGDAFIQGLLAQSVWDGVIRIGAIPTSRIWRDLETRFQLPVFNVTAKPWSGLARTSFMGGMIDLPLLIHHYRERSYPLTPLTTLAHLKDWKEKDLELRHKLNLLCLEWPEAETSLVRDLSFWIQTNPLYLGNSLPVREWDLMAAPFLSRDINGNRGANGIDGQLSSFFGWAPAGNERSFALLGDLTTLYDLTAPWISPQRGSDPWTLIIMNNGGGQIFQPLFGREAFLNRHQVGFEGWARMWNLTYLCLETDAHKKLKDWSLQEKDSLQSTNTLIPQVLEVRPSEKETQQWRKAAQTLWKNLWENT